MRKTIEKVLMDNGYGCNATIRETVAMEVLNQFGSLPQPHKLNLKEWSKVISYAIEVGGCQHGTEFSYQNAQGTLSVAKVFDLYQIPKGLVNPFLVCFSGYMPAAIYTMEALRAYHTKFNEKLPVFATGKGGNKGLFANVFNREAGVMIKTEAEAYMRIMSQIEPADEICKYQRQVEDTDTQGNFAEMYQLAKAQNLSEVTFIMCTGQPWYTKRLLAEGMLEFGKPEYSDIKVNLVVLDCPLTLDSLTPEGHLSELMLGYIAASLGPLLKDTCPLDEPDFTKERYLLPGVAEADWSIFEKLITFYSNMGWNNYQELLYGVDHETAVYNVIMADLRARASFTPEMYEESIKHDIDKYLRFPRANRQKLFCRRVYLKMRCIENHRSHTKYGDVSYLIYKSFPEEYCGWETSSWNDTENHF